MADQTGIQLLTVAIPTVTVLASLLINNSRLTDLKVDRRFDEVNRRFVDTNHKIEDTKEVLRAEMLRIEGVLAARLKHLEQW